MNPRAVVRAVCLVTMFVCALAAHAQDAATTPAAPADPQVVVDGIAKEVAQIRGLSFRQSVAVEKQSASDFGGYVSRRIDETVPETQRNNYGAIVRTLGLYRGPPISDFRGMMTAVMTSQVGAYYDPDKQRFYVVMSGMPEMAQGALY